MSLIVSIAGLSILLWLFTNAFYDILRKSKPIRQPGHNLLIICLTGIYIVKIIVKDILHAV